MGLFQWLGFGSGSGATKDVVTVLQDDAHAMVLAIEKGAAVIYHDVLSAEAVITKWKADHAALMPFVAMAVAYSTGFLDRMGIPVGTVDIVAEDILAALKELASADPTVASGGAAAVAPAPAATAIPTSA